MYSVLLRHLWLRLWRLTTIFSERESLVWMTFTGFNPAAMIAYVIGTAVAVIFMDYGFFISLAVTPIIYYFLAKIFGKTYPAMVSETAADIVIA